MNLHAIPHTGTNFVRELLEWRMGVAVETPRHLFNPEEPNNLSGPTVVPVRDPVMVAISSLNRGEPLHPELWNVYARWAGL